MIKGHGERPAEVVHYRDYIKSPEWEARKEQFFSHHARVCYICGSGDRVELNHIKYGNYGQERDKDLVALCREHHQALHDEIGVRGNMHYATEYFLRTEIAKYDAEHEVPHAAASRNVQKEHSIESFVDKMAKPIWRSIDMFKPKKQ